MPNQPHGNGTGRHVAIPDENRPSWRPTDTNQQTRRSMAEDFDNERWDDEGYRTRGEGYPGTFEDRYRERGTADDRYRSWQDRGERSGTYRTGPRGYGVNDGDRPNLGTGGVQQTGYSRGRVESAPSGHRGKGPIGYERSDERIKELVCEALTDDDRIDASNIEVDVRGGEVILTGTVDDRLMKRLAEDLVDGIRGVKDIQNQIRVMGDKHRR